MKVMLRRNNAGHLTVYVAKKDLEEEVVSEKEGPEGKIFVLANGWEMIFPSLSEPFQLPLTVEGKRVA